MHSIDTITFRNVLPVPLRDTPLSGNVWNNEVTFEKGKNYLIKAESGKGKTTFLNIIHGSRRDYSGTVLFNQNPIEQFDNDTFCVLRSQNISYLFQDLKLFAELTTTENISIGSGYNSNSIQVLQHLHSMGIENHKDRYCGSMSLGQQQRVAAIRAVSQAFDWILLDEPFSHLDERNSLLLRDIIVEVAEQNNAGIIVTSLGSELGFESFIKITL